ncbi:mechanosensitive ion channel [bacterium]|nr:mechanosensitive ion channel [bacterium]
MDFESMKAAATNPEALMALGLPIAKSLLAALAIFIIGRWVAKIAVKVARAAMSKARFDDTLISFLGNVLYGLLLAIIIISALGKLGVDTTSAAALLGGAALAIGLALQDQLSSFAAGVMLIMFRPFGKGNFVDIGGTLGVVEEIKITNTLLKTLDNQLVWVPNSDVWGNTITNFSAMPTRRADLTIGIGYGSDLKKAKEILLRLMEEDERILKDPAPSVLVKELADNSVNFAVRPWMNSPDWWVTRCELIEKIKLEFDANDIEIPFPQRSVHIVKQDD